MRGTGSEVELRARNMMRQVNMETPPGIRRTDPHWPLMWMRTHRSAPQTRRLSQRPTVTSCDGKKGGRRIISWLSADVKKATYSPWDLTTNAAVPVNNFIHSQGNANNCAVIHELFTNVQNPRREPPIYNITQYMSYKIDMLDASFKGRYHPEMLNPSLSPHAEPALS